MKRMRLIDKDALITFIKANGYVYANTLEKFPEVGFDPEENAQLKAERDALLRFKYYFDEMYEKGYDVLGWHLNGEPEPFDDFYEAAVDEARFAGGGTK